MGGRPEGTRASTCNYLFAKRSFMVPSNGLSEPDTPRRGREGVGVGGRRTKNVILKSPL